jgi:hypothetical protein
MRTEFQLENLKGRGHLEDPRHRWTDNIKMELKKQGIMMQTELIWLRIRTSDGLL